MKSYADFSTCGAYRFKLGRDWSDGLLSLGFGIPHDPERLKQYALFIMLNPSTADAERNDPTVAKCERLARRWGFGGLEVRNIFAIRGTDPRVIRQVNDPVGVGNTGAIESAARSRRAGVIVAAWGNHGAIASRSAGVRLLLQQIGRPVYCFAISKLGEPVHPLYQKERNLEEMNRWL